MTKKVRKNREFNYVLLKEKRCRESTKYSLHTRGWVYENDLMSLCLIPIERYEKHSE
jgi:hypothetical protein